MLWMYVHATGGGAVPYDTITITSYVQIYYTLKKEEKKQEISCNNLFRKEKANIAR